MGEGVSKEFTQPNMAPSIAVPRFEDVDLTNEEGARLLRGYFDYIVYENHEVFMCGIVDTLPIS